MNIEIIAVGKLKESYWRDACQEYIKRLGAYCNIKVTEIKESRLTDENPSGEMVVKKAEGKDILSHISDNDYVVTLEIKGEKFSSEAFSEKISAISMAAKPDIVFIIGGSLGLSTEVSERANLKLSFSDMTFPHQMMRVVLLEQVYRAFKINRGETYHK